jgi:serine/threonine kinase PknH
VPEMFGRYELIDLLGRGGMGEVYRAVDSVRDRTVALKLLPRHLATDENFKTRFRRESRMAARLNDPHIIPIHDFGEIDGQLFIDMRLVEGRDLGSVLAERGSLPATTAVKIISQVASALEAAHQAGLVHRDVKPSNVLLAGWVDGEDFDPFAYLVDFGIARSASQEGTALTATSGTVGTVAYMSPERIGGSPGDRRTDIYALGCVLYEVITGHKPYDGEMFAIMYAHMNTPPPRASARVPDSSPALDDVIAKAMAKEPDQRYATASEFALAARQAMRTGPGHPTTTVPSPPPGPGPYGPPPPSGFTPAPPPHPSAPLPTYPTFTPPPGTIHNTPVPTAAPQAFASAPSVPTQHDTPPRHGTPPPGSPPGPVRPGGANQPAGGNGGGTGWPPVVDHPSGPISPAWHQPPARRGKQGLLAGAAAVVVAAVVLTLVFTLGGGGSPGSGGSSGPSGSGSSGPVAETSYKTGGPNTPAVSWEHFGSFSQLVGSSDGDTANSFQDGNCRLSGKGSNDPDGLVDQVVCSYASSPVTTTVARFDDPAKATGLVRLLADQYGYTVTPFELGGHFAGLLFTSPDSNSGINLITYVCGLPNYLVQFNANDKKSTTADAVRGNFWGSSTFPDVTPEPCNTDLTGPEAGTKPTRASGLKTPATPDDEMLKAYIQRGHTEWPTVLVDTPSGSDGIVVGQKGRVSFWRWLESTHALVHDGFSSYPYAPKSLGKPQATARGELLTDMVHATFVVEGHFSTDFSGNAVAYSYDPRSKAWGAIKAATETTLHITNEGVGVPPNDLGLSAGFDFVDGLLETADCSQSLPVDQCFGDNRVLKYWAWDKSAKVFTLDHTGGRTS